MKQTGTLDDKKCLIQYSKDILTHWPLEDATTEISLKITHLEWHSYFPGVIELVVIVKENDLWNIAECQ